MTRYFLGVDGGQSRTTAMIGDESGRVLGVGFSGPSNHTSGAEGRSRFINAINTCLEAACSQAGLNAGAIRFAAACLGFSGGPRDKEEILKIILPSDKTFVTHDALIALSGATAGNPGVVTIAGTGSIAFGRDSEGRIARAGGWGYLFGDEGGAFWIAGQALRAALRYEEGWGPNTALRDALLHATGVPNADDLMHRCYTPEFPRPRVAGLAKLVDEVARQGDRVAQEIVEQAAENLARIAQAVQVRLFTSGESARLTYAGGVFRSAEILHAFRRLLTAEPGPRVEPPAYGPAAGALLEAYRIGEVACALTGVPQEKEQQY